MGICSADGSTHTESNKLCRKVKHRARPNLSSRQRPKRAPIRRRLRRRQRRGEPYTEHGLGVLKTFFHFEAFVHKSSILLVPTPTRIADTFAIGLHDYCAINDPQTITLLYAIPHTILVMAISCKGQATLDRTQTTHPNNNIRCAHMRANTANTVALCWTAPSSSQHISSYTVLLVPILYGVYHTKGGSGGTHILRNGRAIV